MKPLHILIADDEPPARSKLRKLLEMESRVQRLSEAENGIEAVEKIETEHPDLVFLDIQMPGMTGFEVVESINSDEMPAIIFVTAYDAYAIDAFEVDAVDYLLKPCDKPRFQKAFRRALKRIDTEDVVQIGYSNLLAKMHPKKERFLIKEMGRYFFIPIEDVLIIRTADKYVEIETARSRYLIGDTLTHLETCLDRRFVRIHRSTIINSKEIKEIQSLSHGDCSVTMTTGKSVVMSRRYRDRLMH